MHTVSPMLSSRGATTSGIGCAAHAADRGWDMDIGMVSFDVVEQVPLHDVELVVDGLAFPEGPVAVSDGSVILVELERGTLSRVADGHIEVIAECGRGANGAQFGPDGAVYLCNNGGRFPDHRDGRIQRVDLDTGKVEDLYSGCDGRPLLGPNDLVFDATGNFWFTDLGKVRDTYRDYGRVFYASPDGNHIGQHMDRLETPNGIGLSPDGNTLYVAETFAGRIVERRISAPGVLEDDPGELASLLLRMPAGHWFDSLAVDARGNVVVATLRSGCITAVSPDGGRVWQYLLPEEFRDEERPTNICFGGPDLQTAFITLSDTGRLVRCPWPEPGLPLHFAR